MAKALKDWDKMIRLIRTLEPKKRMELKKLLLDVRTNTIKEQEQFNKLINNPLKRRIELIDELLKNKIPIEYYVEVNKKITEHISKVFSMWDKKEV